MARFSGAAAFDFGDLTTAPAVRPAKAGLRLALPSGVLRGPQKYEVLEHRRRQAQIKARRLLDLIESEADLIGSEHAAGER
jgi:hypothetical protein